MYNMHALEINPHTHAVDLCWPMHVCEVKVKRLLQLFHPHSSNRLASVVYMLRKVKDAQLLFNYPW